MLSNCQYNKNKLLHKLSCLLWFIEKHAKHDATKEGHKKCENYCDQLAKDLQQHIERIKLDLKENL